MAKRGGFPGMGMPGNMNNLMKQAQKMQRQMEENQKALEEKEFTAAAGGGAVEVTISGKREVTKVKLAEEVVDPDDIEMLEDLIVAATNEALRRVEQEIAINELGYNEKTAPITGFARWDVLEDKQADKEKFILLMPTWRSWLEEVSDNQFLVSDYYKKYSSLLQSPRLNQILKDTNTRLIFYIHPKFAGYIDNFKAAVSNRVTYIPFGKIPLNELMMRCSMLITDYSSVCWDVYYMDKPVLFYQFDYDMYNQAHGSYINMENDLFGNRSTTEDALLNDVEYFANNGFVENEKDRLAAPKYFEYRDNNNSKRIYDFLKNNGF